MLFLCLVILPACGLAEAAVEPGGPTPDKCCLAAASNAARASLPAPAVFPQAVRLSENQSVGGN